MSRIWFVGKRVLKRVLSFKPDRGIIEFLVFLIVAIIFWFSQTFKDQTSVSISYQLRLTNVPRNVILTSDPPETIEVAVAGRGFAIVQYLFDGQVKVVELDYSDLQKMNGTVLVDNYALKKAVGKALPGGVSYASANPSAFDIYYSTGSHKRIPVKMIGQLRTANQYQLCGVDMTPQYVDVYAPQQILDTLTYVATQPVVTDLLSDTVSMRLALQPISGAKMMPDTVSIRACVDLFTTKTLTVPIYCENIPDGQILRTFPLNASVSFVVSATMFNHVNPNDFIVVVDYNSIGSDDRKCRLQLRQAPQDVSNVRVSPELVDYIIEHE